MVGGTILRNERANDMSEKKHICVDCKKNCHFPGLKIYDCGDFDKKEVQVKLRWFFSTISHCIYNNNGILTYNKTRDRYSCLTLPELVGQSEYIEVQKRDLPYLERPEGDWVFKKVESGDNYISTFVDHDGKICHGEIMKDEAHAPIFQGYRWVKAERKGIVETRGEKEWKEGRFVEYPIDGRRSEYICAVEHQHKEYKLHELPSIVGFAGVQFDNFDVWTSDLSLFGKISKPMTPVKARFWVEGAK